MPDANTSGGALPDGSQLNPADANIAVAADNAKRDGSALATAETMTLEDINKSLNKDYKTKEDALKSLRETFSFVGKKTDEIKKQVVADLNTNERLDSLTKQLQDERTERFYDRNPQYAEPAVRKLIERMGGNPTDAVNSEEFKAVFSKVAEYDKSAKLKTVLESNPRLAVSKDNLQKAREIQESAFKTGSFQGRDKEEVERLATDAVKQAFNL